jgi:hypothetical protein
MTMNGRPRTDDQALQALLRDRLTALGTTLGPNATADELIAAINAAAPSEPNRHTARTADKPPPPGRGHLVRRAHTALAERRAAKNEQRYQALRRRAAATRVGVTPPVRAKVAAPLNNPGHTMTGHDASGLVQDAYEPAVSPAGPVLGTETHSGTAVRVDPWYSYLKEMLSPNFFVVGVQGSGKSFALKLYATRQERAGRYICVIDPKDAGGEGEWAAMGRSLGWTVIPWGPRSRTRLNILDAQIARTSDNEEDLTQLALLVSILATELGRSLDQIETYALSVALDRVHADYQLAYASWHLDRDFLTGNPGEKQPRVPIASDLAHAILFPTDEAATRINMEPIELVRASRAVGVALYNFLRTEIGRTVDAPTTLDANLMARGIVWDVSQVPRESRALPIVMTIINTFVHNAWWQPDGRKRILIIDEATLLLRHLGTARALEASEKTSRGKGISHMVAVQHTENVTGARTDPDLEAAIAAVINEAEIVAALRQDAGQAQALAKRRLLPKGAIDRLPALPSGNMLLLVGSRPPFELRTTPTEAEWELMNSDKHMAQTPVPPSQLTWAGTQL